MDLNREFSKEKKDNKIAKKQPQSVHHPQQLEKCKLRQKFEISSYPNQSNHDQENNWQLCWRHGQRGPLICCWCCSAVTTEIRGEKPQKAENSSTLQPCYTKVDLYAKESRHKQKNGQRLRYVILGILFIIHVSKRLQA